VGAAQVAQMRGAGARLFGAFGLRFGRAAARAGIAHRLAPVSVAKREQRLQAVCSWYVLLFRTIRQGIFLKFIIEFVLKSRIIKL
jgi:hypothetical protein